VRSYLPGNITPRCSRHKEIFSQLCVQECCEDNISMTLPKSVLTNHEKRKELGISALSLFLSVVLSNILMSN
jgi:hypothetical protein